MKETQLDELDIVRRAWVLRKQRLIGVLWAEAGRFWISESEFDPYGTRARISLAALKDLVERIESEQKVAQLARKPAAAESAPAALVKKAGA